MTIRIVIRAVSTAQPAGSGMERFNRKDAAIDYHYASRLKGQAAEVNDIHFHPIEPRSFRVNLTYNFR